MRVPSGAMREDLQIFIERSCKFRIWGSFLEWNVDQFQRDTNCHPIRRILPTVPVLGSQLSLSKSTLEGASTENKAVLQRPTETNVTSGFGQASAISKASGS